MCSCCPIWEYTDIKILQKVQKLQNRATRIGTNSHYDAHSEPLIKELGKLTIKKLINTETAKIVYKAFHNKAPEYVTRLFHSLSDTQSRNSSEQKIIAYRGAYIWNTLSNEGRNELIFLAFKATS